MGRSLGFLSRIAQDGWSANPREIAVDEKSAILVASDGSAKIVGTGKGAYFLELTKSPDEGCLPGKPLTIDGVSTYHAPRNSTFNLNTWSGAGGDEYTLAVVKANSAGRNTSPTSPLPGPFLLDKLLRRIPVAAEPAHEFYCVPPCLLICCH